MAQQTLSRRGSEQPAQRARNPPGFFRGFASPFLAMRFLARTPATWPSAIVPAVVFAVLAVAGTLLGVFWVTPWVLSWFAPPDSWWTQGLHWLGRFLLYLACLVVGMWTALIATPPLCSTALEQLVAAQESELEVAPRAPQGFVKELMCGLRAQLFGLCCALPVVFGLRVVEILLPPLALLTVPLQITVTGLALAWNLLDYPLTLRGVPASDRLGFFITHWPVCIGFGLGFTLLFWVPCFGVLMLPVGVVAATRLLYALLESQPQELPKLPRPGSAGLLAEPESELEGSELD